MVLSSKRVIRIEQMLLLLFSLAGFACHSSVTPQQIQTVAVVPTVNPMMRLGTPISEAEETLEASAGNAETKVESSEEQSNPDVLKILIDSARDAHPGHPISPLIYGLSGASDEEFSILKPTLMSWGGNPSTRYNWKLGHAWNAGRDWFYRNGNYGYTGESASDDAVAGAEELGIEMRLAVPILGWVAKDDDLDTCSFPLPDGSCGMADDADCANPGDIADPTLANVPTDPNFIRQWLEHLYIDQGFDIRFIAMDNEPELWGYTHYDVHPECTTYAEILEKFLTYSAVVREVAPQAEITGPITCCWYYYWNSAAGPEDMAAHGNQPFLSWFLEQVRQHDEAAGYRSLDVLDIHFYPEGVYNDNVDEETAALRLRSTRLLWDPDYVEETWIGEPVALIPLMKELIDRYYPGTRLGLSEWNWGADSTMNGALAIADVLGTFGREDLYFAAYWRNPALNSPGFFAFQLYTNYDGQGGRFGDLSVWSETTDYDSVSSYSALNSDDGRLHLMVVNKVAGAPLEVQVDLGEFKARPEAEWYRLAEADLSGIVTGTAVLDGESSFTLLLPPYSITHLVISPAG